MAAKPIGSVKSESIVADWRTGEYSQQRLAEKHGVSKGVVNKLCKGVEQDTAAIVTAGVLYRQGLAAHDDRNVTAVTAAVDEITKHIQFFTNVTIKNLSIMAEKIDGATTIMEHRVAQAAIRDGRETVLGKQPDTAIQINNSNTSAITADEFKETARKLLTEI